MDEDEQTENKNCKKDIKDVYDVPPISLKEP